MDLSVRNGEVDNNKGRKGQFIQKGKRGSYRTERTNEFGRNKSVCKRL